MESMKDIKQILKLLNVTWGKEAVTRTKDSFLLAIISEIHSKFENLGENHYKTMAIVNSKCWNELPRFKL